MHLVNVAVIVTGIVLVVQQVNGHCSCSCTGGGTEIIKEGGKTMWITSGSGCGLGPGVDICGNCAKDGSTWGGIGGTLNTGVAGIVGLENAGGFTISGGFGGRGGNPNAPIVVRPQEVPRPPIALPVSLLPVPGPCTCKKAIVKPAVLPRPVCKAVPQVTEVIGGGVFGSKTITKNWGHHSSSTILGSSSGIIGNVGTVVGTNLAGGPIVVDNEGEVISNQANLAPADAVSLSLAYQSAHKNYRVPVEDRLTFGFRKIPEEVPHPVVIKNNIPEEQIFNLNGQVVELKPVAISSQKTVEEEAHEDLLDLQEEETAAGCGASNIVSGPIRRISLGEIGYAPAKLSKKTFVDVPSGAVGEAVHGISQTVNGLLGAGSSTGASGAGGALASATGALGAAGSALGSAAAAAAGALGAAAGALGGAAASSNGYVPGNVVYKTVPKLNQALVPLPEVLPDEEECQSQETSHQTLSFNDGGYGTYGSDIIATGVSCGTCCKPCCTSHTFHSTSASSLSALSSAMSSSSLTSSSSSLSPCGKKASVLVQRLR